jgi:hypothetical protein
MTNMRELGFSEVVLVGGEGGGATEYFCSTHLISQFIRDAVESYGRSFNVVFNSAECKPEVF